MLRTVAALAALSIAAPVAAQEATWTPIFFQQGNYFFVEGGPQTRSGPQPLAMAVVPIPGQTEAGQTVGHYIVSGTVDCSAWTLSVASIEYFDVDGAAMNANRTPQPARTITAESAIQVAAEVRCRGKRPTGDAMTRDQIVSLAQRLR